MPLVLTAPPSTMSELASRFLDGFTPDEMRALWGLDDDAIADAVAEAIIDPSPLTAGEQRQLEAFWELLEAKARRDASRRRRNGPASPRLLMRPRAASSSPRVTSPHAGGACGGKAGG